MTEPMTPERSKPRNRLTDIVVEEVSLVDRAANKHRFLIVKRSDEMDETTNQQVSENETGATDNTDTDEVITDLNEQSGNDAESDRDSPLGVALAALEGLTETVELLGSIDEQVASSRLGELSGDLKGIADRLERITGAKPQGDGAQSSESNNSGTSTDHKPANSAEAVEAIRTTLQRVKAILEQGAKDKPTGDKPSNSAPTGDNSISEQLFSLTNELRALTTSVKEQQQRLTKLEKRFGIPNSTASNEQRRRPETDEVGWPLDMNRACDRESVDKSVSFHDV